jgi:cobalt-precorrin-5B (C1)-methyltransferase
MYATVDGKRLRCGYTTGTCASAASKAAAMYLISGECPDSVAVATPSGREVEIEIEDRRLEDGYAVCSVRKDGGDDIDATHGILIFSKVSVRKDGLIVIDGGEGVGRVTKNGLDQPVGNAAINSRPRMMINGALADVRNSFDITDGFDVVISAPEGAATAKRTFNSRLGIVGGISILGTSGIVEPMSDAGLMGAVRAEMDVRMAEGGRFLLIVPGNMGKAFSEDLGADDKAVKCSNFIGETIDYAVGKKAEGILVIGNLGKMIKVAGGMMNTHSRWGDCRMELLAAGAVEVGADADAARRILGCATTDDALCVMGEELRMKTMERIMERIAFHLGNRAGDVGIEAVVFSSKYGKVGETSGAERMMNRIAGAGR